MSEAMSAVEVTSEQAKPEQQREKCEATTTAVDQLGACAVVAARKDDTLDTWLMVLSQTGSVSATNPQ